ncbi:MAG: OPT/YSL family transporter [Phycisphaerales bacterium]
MSDQSPGNEQGGLLRDVFQTRYREVTISAIILGVLLGVVMNAAITYAGLKIGFTIGGSAIAAVLGFGILRGVLRRGTILETNITQTVASSVNTSNSGIIFTVPALYLLGVEFNIWLMLAACVAGAVLGVAFIIPTRKQMIDIERLRFPSAYAVGAILKAPGAGVTKSLVLVAGMLVAALIFLPTQLPVLTDGKVALSNLGWSWLGNETIDVGMIIGLPAEMQFIFAIAPFALGAGYLTGRAGLVVLAGGVLAYLVINPIAFNLGWLPESVEAAGVGSVGRSLYNQPLGIGLLLGGAVMGILAALPALKAALKSLRAASGRPGSEEMSLGFLAVAILVAFAVLFITAHLAIGAESGGLLSGLPKIAESALIAVVGTGWIWFAGIIIAQCTGMTDWSPISGLALLTVVLVMFLAGTSEVVASVLVGAALCTAITECADMMADLRTGYIVGAKPKRQQFVEIFASALGPAVTFATIALIVASNTKQFGIPMGEGTPTIAPQAVALKGVIEAVQGGAVPYALYGAGALLGLFLGLGSFAGLGVLVGLSMYLPIVYILPYGLGCLVNLAVTKVKGRRWAEDWGIPFCAGLIVGEAILALGVNSYVLLASAG